MYVTILPQCQHASRLKVRYTMSYIDCSDDVEWMHWFVALAVVIQSESDTKYTETRTLRVVYHKIT